MHGVQAGGEGLLSRKSSGTVYDNFPCVRVGDYDLPSSMDLRQYLDEMQEVGQWEDDVDLPTIPDDEVCYARSSLELIYSPACAFFLMSAKLPTSYMHLPQVTNDSQRCCTSLTSSWLCHRQAADAKCLSLQSGFEPPCG